MLRLMMPLSAGLVLVGCATYPAAVEQDLPVYERAVIEDDLNAFLDQVKATHPDLSYSADLDAVAAKREEIAAALPETMDAREAWMAMAQLNPLFADAHVGLRRPLDLIAAQADASGAELMTLPVRVTADDRIEVAATSERLPGVEDGATIVAINGIATETILADLMPRMRGESELLRALILALRFDAFFWTAYGAFEGYEITVDGEDGRATHTLLPGTAEPANAPYDVRQLTPRIAYLDVPSFDIAREEEFAEFLPGAFEAIHDAGATTLIVDIRENTGGATELSDRLMAFLTDEPYTATSKIKARVTEANQGLLPGVPLGAVLDVPFADAVTPPNDLEHRFTGETVIFIGPLSYSQSIVFTATAIDAEVATIAGQPTEGPANQTAQVQTLPLPNTEFQALAPLYIITRSSGEEGREVITPDIPISADGDHGLEELVTVLRNRD
ncbi:MAG: S41 family peptidase [Pseudomonadota bacterium]